MAAAVQAPVMNHRADTKVIITDARGHHHEGEKGEDPGEQAVASSIPLHHTVHQVHLIPVGD
jgi:hypothetical protein